MLERRGVLKGLASLPLATVLADPAHARAAAETTQLVKLKTAAGRDVAGALAKPDGSGPVVLLFHEWWGLNDQIKAVAVDLARQGYVALAVDLFNGRVATDADTARALIQKVDEAEAADTVTTWVAWARNYQDANRKVGTLGWCFGGGWSLATATMAPVDATVVYYGKCDLPAERLARLKGPVLGHFGTLDPMMNKAMVSTFEANMKAAGKPYQVYWYEANHAFANPTGANFHKADAQLAWSRTLDFLKANLAI